jgi:hypothetical protein
MICSFKIVYSSITFKYAIEPLWSSIDLYTKIKDYVNNNYQLGNIEIIYFNDKENGKAIPYIDKKIKEILYPFTNKDNAFYLRIINENPINTISYNNTNRTITGEIRYSNNNNSCGICYENNNIFIPINNCNHEICRECYISCYNTNNINCPMCRNGNIVRYIFSE